MFLALDGQGAAYQQIYRALRRAIAEEQIGKGTRLPSSRVLARDLKVSRNTVLLAYEQLLAEGHAISKAGAGTFVADREITSVPPAPLSTQSLAGHSEANLSNYARRAIFTPYRIFGPSPRNIRYDFKYGVSSPQDFPFRSLS